MRLKMVVVHGQHVPVAHGRLPKKLLFIQELAQKEMRLNQSRIEAYSPLVTIRRTRQVSEMMEHLTQAHVRIGQPRQQFRSLPKVIPRLFHITAGGQQVPQHKVRFSQTRFQGKGAHRGGFRFGWLAKADPRLR